MPELKVDKEALDLARELIERKAGKFEPAQFKDEYNEAMWELIHAKLEHREPEFVVEEPATAKVINIMDALKKSVKQGQQAKGKSAPQAKRGAAAERRESKKTGRAAPKRKSA